MTNPQVEASGPRKSPRRRILSSAVIAVCVIALALGGMYFAAPQWFPFGNIAPTSVAVVVTFLGDDPPKIVDTVLVNLEKAIDGVPGQRCLAFAAKPTTAAIIVQFKPGTDMNEAVKNVQDRIDAAKDLLPQEAEEQGITLMKAVKSSSIYVKLAGPIPPHSPDTLSAFARSSVLPVLNQITRVGPAMMLGDHQRVLRMKLNIEQMIRLDVTEQHITTAMMGSGMVGSVEDLFKTVWRGAGTVELCYHGAFGGSKAEQYGAVVLKANADGEVVRLSDVAQLDLVPLYPSFYNRYPTFGDVGEARVVLLKLPSVKSRPIVERVKKEMGQIEKNSAPDGVKFEVTYELPATWCLGHADAKPASGS